MRAWKEWKGNLEGRVVSHLSVFTCGNGSMVTAREQVRKEKHRKQQIPISPSGWRSAQAMQVQAADSGTAPGSTRITTRPGGLSLSVATNAAQRALKARRTTYQAHSHGSETNRTLVIVYMVERRLESGGINGERLLHGCCVQDTDRRLRRFELQRGVMQW